MRRQRCHQHQKNGLHICVDGVEGEILTYLGSYHASLRRMKIAAAIMEFHSLRVALASAEAMRGISGDASISIARLT